MFKNITPLSLSSKLAATPEGAPTYNVELTSKGGKKLQLADPSATRAMVALMDMQAVMGGAASHWGGPSAFAELMSALHGLMFSESRQSGKAWFELFNFVNDAGHCENGLYALKANYHFAGLSLKDLKKFRSIESPLTGHGESHLFPEGVLLSNGPLGSAFPQSQGLAYADHLAGRNRVTVTAISDGASMEGEAKEAFAAIPGLAKEGKLAPYVLIISDNNTKLSGRIDKDAFSMAPTFASLKELGWDVLHLERGHDLQACVDTIEEALQRARKNPAVPVAIHAKTIKGYGVKKCEESSSGGHGFPLKGPDEVPAFLNEIYRGKEIPQEFQAWAEEMQAQAKVKAAAKAASSTSSALTDKVQAGVAKALIAKREKGIPLVSISSDLAGSTGVAAFQKKFPECTQDVGVAEANMISMAAGLSVNGFIPVVDTFSQFGVTKGALPLAMAALSSAPVIGIFSHAGFQDAADGASHQALGYLAMTSSLPHTQVYVLSCSDEAEALVGQAVEEFAAKRAAGETPDSYLFFLGRENFPLGFGAKNYKLRSAQVLKDTSAEFSKSVTLAVCGPLVPQALLAADALASKNVGAVVVNVSSIQPVDVETLSGALKKTSGYLITAEDHQVIGGMGAQLVHELSQHGVAMKAQTLGVKGKFGRSAYNAIELYRLHGLDSESLAQAALRILS